MKEQISAMRGILVCLLAFFTLTLNSCKKQLLLNESEELKGALSVSEAKSYFVSKFPVSKKGSVGKSTFTGPLTLQTLFADKQPIWDMAYQKMISTGGAVKIPLDFGEAYAVVNEKTKAIVPAASLNYLLMYKDARDSIRAEWVRLAPDSAWLYGKRDSYKGKIFIYDWNGKQIKNLSYGSTYIQQKTQVLNRAATHNSNGTIEIEDCYRFSNGRCPKTGVCSRECDMCLSTCAYEICIVATEPICQNCPENPPRPGGGGSGSGGESGSSSEGGGGSGTPSPADYAPNCNPDPNYVAPNYPAPQGMDWMMPCGGDVPVPETPNGSYDGLDLSQNTLAFARKLVLNRDQASFMEAHQDIMNAINAYLGTGEVSIEANEFAKWAVEHLRENPSLFNQAFKDLLNGVYNENSPIYIPSYFNVAEDAEWNDIEDEVGYISVEISQQGLPYSDPIPESYYKNGTAIDMSKATAQSRTVKGAPRNAGYFWKELIKKRPEMFSPENREYIAKNELKKIKVDQQWIKYNPTHKSYEHNQLVHHHHEQGKMAYAIPAKVHQKWTRILHAFRAKGFSKIRGSLNSLVSAIQMFSLLTDINTGNPDAWVNWFGGANEVGKIYKQPFTGDYFEITKQTLIKNDQGKVVFAYVTYDVYADYIWDADEKRYMGVLKLGTFTEDIDMSNKRSTQSKFELPDSRI